MNGLPIAQEVNIPRERIRVGFGPWLTVGPPLIYLVIFFVFPMMYFLLVSFWTKQGYGIARIFTLENYIRIFQNDLYREILVRSAWIGFASAVVCVVVSYPVGYALAFRFRRAKSLVLFLLLVTMSASYLVRIYAWRVVMGGNGLFSAIAMWLGLAKESHYYLLYSDVGVVLVLVSLNVPLITLPIYSSLRNIGPQIIEAARDLGASAATTFRRVTFPLSSPGVRSAFLFAFILCSSDYVVPRMIGGPSGVLIGSAIGDQFGIVNNWPLGSALTFVMIAVFMTVFGLIELLMRRLKLYR